MVADLACVHFCVRDVLGVYPLCRFIPCQFSMGRPVEVALGNSFLLAVYLLCRNRTGHHVVLCYLAVSCAFFRNLSSFSPVYISHICRSQNLAFLQFFIFLQRCSNWCMRASSITLEKHSLPKITNDVWVHLTWGWMSNPCQRLKMMHASISRELWRVTLACVHCLRAVHASPRCLCRLISFTYLSLIFPELIFVRCGVVQQYVIYGK